METTASCPSSPLVRLVRKNHPASVAIETASWHDNSQFTRIDVFHAPHLGFHFPTLASPQCTTPKEARLHILSHLSLPSRPLSSLNPGGNETDPSQPFPFVTPHVAHATPRCSQDGVICISYSLHTVSELGWRPCILQMRARA